MELLLEYFGKGIMVMLTITMPCICTAAAIGLVVGILQAVTQVQEQTIAAAPKVLGVFLIILLGGVGFLRMITNVFIEGTELAFNGVSKSDSYVLNSDYYRYTSPFATEMNAGAVNQSGNVEKIMKNPGKTPFLESTEKVKNYPSNRTPHPTPNFVEQQKIRSNQQ